MDNTQPDTEVLIAGIVAAPNSRATTPRVDVPRTTAYNLLAIALQ